MGTPFVYARGAAGEAIQRLNRFALFCKQHQVRVYFSHPPFSRPLFERSRQAIDLVEEDLRKELKITMLDTPQDVVFDPGDFFDTAYHLTAEARVRRSQRLAESLAAKSAAQY
jgi:hypothetical protein